MIEISCIIFLIKHLHAGVQIINLLYSVIVNKSHKVSNLNVTILSSERAHLSIPGDFLTLFAARLVQPKE